MKIVEDIKAGDIRAVSRVIRNIEDQNPKVREVIKELYPYTGNARIVGLTGAPGAGKSTFTDSLITHYRRISSRGPGCGSHQSVYRWSHPG